jgi:light-regulated signal transduction histidine kinase (bacteriophytochrome)
MEDYAGRLDDDGLRICSVISDSARDMGTLIDDLLTFSRTGRAAINPTVIDMNAVVTTVYHELTTPESRAGHDFQLGELPPCLGDPALVRQVWVNLLSNAIKFSSRKDRPEIRVTASPSADGTIYCVRDNGAGFDMSYANKLFGVFQRLHSSKEFEGTGVGLAIVQRIIHRHGGRIWAEGETGKGAAFHFTLGPERTA